MITFAQFTTMQHMLDSRNSPQARKRSEREATSPFLSRAASCDDCDVYMCRGTNQKRPALYCPECSQTIGRTALDAYLIDRLLIERADELIGDLAVDEAAARAGHDDMARRAVLVTQLDRLVIRRGVVGRYCDGERVLLTWSS